MTLRATIVAYERAFEEEHNSPRLGINIPDIAMPDVPSLEKQGQLENLSCRPSTLRRTLPWRVGSWRRGRRRIGGKLLDDLLLHPQLIDQEPGALLHVKTPLRYTPCAIQLHALSEGRSYNGISPNDTGVYLIVERTPGASLFVLFAEPLPCHLYLVDAAVKTIRRM
jgi:hypothetical protein